MFSVTVGSSKTAYEHEQLSVKTRAETLMYNVITLSEAGPSTHTTKLFSFQLQRRTLKLA